MLNDRMARTAVQIDEDANAEEMEVVLSAREVVLVTQQPDLSLYTDAEPWLRIRDGRYVSFGVTLIPHEDDQA